MLETMFTNFPLNDIRSLTIGTFCDFFTICGVFLIYWLNALTNYNKPYWNLSSDLLHDLIIFARLHGTTLLLSRRHCDVELANSANFPTRSLVFYKSISYLIMVYIRIFSFPLSSKDAVKVRLCENINLPVTDQF